MRQNPRLTVAIVTAVVVGLNFLAAVFVLRSQAVLGGARSSVEHTYDVIHEVDSLFADIARRAAATRGWLLGGGDRSLTRSKQANERIEQHMNALRLMLGTEHTSELNHLSQLLDQQSKNWHAEIDSKDRAAAIALAIGPSSVEVGTETRTLLEHISNEERTRLELGWSGENDAAWRNTFYAVIMTLLSIVSMLGAGRIVLQQLTARNKAEKELESRSTLLRTTVESLDRGLAVFDREHRLLVWNEQFIRLGLSSADRIKVGTALADVVAQDAGAIIAGAPYERTAANDVTLEVRRTAMPNGGFVVTWTDISSRIRVERLKNEFISTVSHELRTPLTSIIGSLGLLRGGVAGELPSEASSLLEIAHRNGERLVRLISDILDVEKIESGRMDFTFQTLDLMPILRASIEANAGYAERFNVRLVLTDAIEGARITVDRVRLEQVLANLLSNAAKFSPAGDQVEIGVTRHQERLRVFVRDHGPGVPEKFQHRLFERFAQADTSNTRAKGGTGLGLSISRAIMQRQGGSIGFDTKEGAGSTFYIEVPETPDLAVTQPPPRRGPRVLVCEDDPQAARALSWLLERAGFVCSIAASARETLDQLANRKYDLITLDIFLPDQDGITLLKNLRANPATRDLPVVVISAVGPPSATGIEGNALGIVDWIQKPTDGDAVLQAVQKAARSGRRPRVLHVEDDLDVLSIVARSLRDTADVVGVTSVADARLRIADSRFDLAILDLQLPDGLGPSLLPLFGASSPSPTPVIIFSAHQTPADVSSQVAAVLEKSKTSAEQLVGIVRDMAVRAA